MLHILEEDFSSSVNKTVEENQKEKRRQKKVTLPNMDDIKLLNQFLTNNRKKCLLILENKLDFDAWMDLAKYTLTSVQMFNRRRAGEIERITIADFNTYQTVNEDVDHDIFNSLSSESKMAARQYIRFEIRGKLARGVPVLLHKEIFNCIKTILQYRKNAGVSDSNPFVFWYPRGQ
ncbi:hypothetical protein NQ314_016503 [Rhamnusium bicolor]|uniref:Uncharacterized protein n=1 Tax=Rhamnusium bicolor TaxID=1586634 RepID=A0AAV8WW10_9CUCU|nr:hypothetical protein NQ314_016503 [Rhamnusium bicolor]